MHTYFFKETAKLIKNPHVQSTAQHFIIGCVAGTVGHLIADAMSSKDQTIEKGKEPVTAPKI